MKKFIEQHPYWSILIMWMFVFLSHSGTLAPNIMEARNFVTAREMVTEGNWILTTMDGLPRYEKPPLPTWLTAVSGKLFGFDSLAALRLPAALITLVLLVFTFSLSRKLTQNKTYALIATFVLGTSFFVVFSGRDGSWDIFAHSFMLVGIYYLYQFFENNTNTYRNALLAGLCLGFSFMSKGPVSHYALLLPFLIAYGTLYKFKNLRSKWAPLSLMIFVTAGLSSWWGIYIYQMDPFEATRIAEKESGRWVGYELKPFYYYWSFFTQSGVWTVPAFIALLYPFMKSRVSNLKVYRLTILWALIAVVLLSLIPTKKSRYLLPVLIPLAMTTGCYIEYLFHNFKSSSSKWVKWPVYFNFGLVGLIGLAFPVIVFFWLGTNLEGYYTYYVISSLGLMFAGLWMLLQLYKSNLPQVFYTTILFFMLLVGLAFPLYSAVSSNVNYNPISRIQDHEMPVYVFEDLGPELVWDYGKVSTRKTKTELLGMNDQLPVGVITVITAKKNKLDFLKRSYKVEWKETFDINTTGSTNRNYKRRLKADFYVISQKD